MSAEASPPAAGLISARLLSGLGLLLVAVYAVFLWRHTDATPGGSDSSGYFNLARLLRAGEVHAPVHALENLPPGNLPPYTYVPLGFSPVKGAPEKLVPTYPAGLPLFYAGSSVLAGWETGPRLVMLLHALAGVLLVHGLARQAGASRPTAWLATAALAVSPLAVMFSVQAMSDVPALTWTAAALYSALAAARWRGGAAAAGFCLGVAVLVRPSNLLLALPLLVALGPEPRRWLWFGLGGLPWAVFLGWFNWQTYGAVLTTGYGDVRSAFSTAWLGAGLASYVRWLPALLSPLVLLAPGLGFVRGPAARVRTAHGLWILLNLGFYAPYYHTHETWWYLRFILPAFPSLLVAVAVTLDATGRRLPAPGWRWAAGAAAALLVLGNGWFWSAHFQVQESGRGEGAYRVLAERVRVLAPDHAVVLAMQASGALRFHNPQVIARWDAWDHAWPQVREAARAAGRPVFAVVFEFEREDFSRAAPGHWTMLEEHRGVRLLRLDEPAVPVKD